MYRITKEFDFCYGHRVWNQQLQTEFSLDDRCVCRHLHGHQGKIVVTLSSDSIGTNGMVTDFKHLNWFKQWLDSTFDHKMIMDVNDPIVPEMILHRYKSIATSKKPPHGLVKTNQNRILKLPGRQVVNLYVPDSEVYNNRQFSKSEQEVLEGLICVDFVPTSENLSQMFFRVIEAKMFKLDVFCESVQFCETPKTSASTARTDL